MSHSYDRYHDFERTMELNYFGSLKLILGLLPTMRERKGGQIVTISSIGVQTNAPRFSAYVASKAALDAFSRSIPGFAKEGRGRRSPTAGARSSGLRTHHARDSLVGRGAAPGSTELTQRRDRAARLAHASVITFA